MLETLRLGGNGRVFSVGKLEWLSYLSRLKEVNLSFTNLSNANDWSLIINHLPLLQKLNLRDCDLPSISSFSVSLTNSSTSLNTLDLSHNNLPSSAIYPCDNLFILAENQVRGDSGLNEIRKLPDINILDLGYNLLNGSISKRNSFDSDVISEAHFSNFTYLRNLDLSYTSLTLKVNTGWILPFQLSQRKHCSCKLGPRFPDWVRPQRDVLTPRFYKYSKDYLDISASGILDSLPYWFWDKFWGFSYINMSFNQISGTFPNASIHTSHLDLSSNNFSGPLQCFSLDISKMMSINLSKNKFTGSVSPICNIIGDLALFDLSNNLFAGVVPDCFESFPFLTALNLGDNGFSGSLPSSLGYLISLEMLSLRGNKFSGELPSSLQNCAKLKFLDLSDNELSREIPMWIGQKLSSLVFLSLQGN
ncbi:receptor-like protein EIX2 [Gossypium arboreum]|uniref:receptor-like protein EIX2 n=1 Tax=Gossypium arboreum TaxID=29729 RepID=UPI0022F1BC96|nr:receptor-like protein EIX2 [Gossypium arboreum]